MTKRGEGARRRSGNNRRNCQHYEENGAIPARMFGDNTLAYRPPYRAARHFRIDIHSGKRKRNFYLLDFYQGCLG